MHTAICNCPQCRGAAEGFEFETFEFGESEEILGEQEELELAMELLHVRNDQELEQFLGDLVKSVGRGLKAVGSFAAKNVLPVVGPVLKQIAKTALPIAGGALGSLIPIPGVGTALGSALGGVVANALEMEVAGLNRNDADVEKARRFVRLAATAIRDAAAALGSESPDSIARTALVNATVRHLPAAASAVAAAVPLKRELSAVPAPSAIGAGGHLGPGQSGPGQSGPGQSGPGHSGHWRRHGRHIIVHDV